MNFRNAGFNHEMQSPYFNPNDDKALANSRNSRDDFLGYENKNNDGSELISNGVQKNHECGKAGRVLIYWQRVNISE